jgi:lipopolysaccharide/colanic/teichoic acid biosynthesis glycosyltransferase
LEVTQTFERSLTDIGLEQEALGRASSRAWMNVVKRSTDLVLSALLLLLFLPLIFLVAIAVKLESRGPVFYRAARVGRHGAPLMVLKFRKMKKGAAGIPLTGHDDPRFTRIGCLLAKWKLDEIPQLWNVLLGQMSLVGPRPEDLDFVSLHSAEYGEILTVRPGITGLGQLAFTREAQILDPHDAIGHYVKAILPQKVQLDRLYAHSWKLRGDFQILVWTILPVILRVDVAVNRTTGSLTIRRRRTGSTTSR